MTIHLEAWRPLKGHNLRTLNSAARNSAWMSSMVRTLLCIHPENEHQADPKNLFTSAWMSNMERNVHNVCIHPLKRAPSRSETLWLLGFWSLRLCMGSSGAWYYHILARMWTFRHHRSWFERQFRVFKLYRASILRRFWKLLRAKSWFERQFHRF